MIEKEIFRRQFLISKTECNGIPVDSVKIQLLSGGFLYADKAIKIEANTDNSCVLIGDAWQTDPKQRSPQALIRGLDAGTSNEAVYDMEYTWTGRYLLIVGNRVFTDCCNQLGVFYGKGCVSSSLTVLCELNDIPLVYPKIDHRVSKMDYMPGENTMYEQFRRLLASQVLHLDDFTVEYRPLLPHGIEEYENDEARTEAFKSHFKCGLQNMRSQLEGRFVLALTGGVDSRTNFALLQDAGIDFDTFTLNFKHMDPGDREIPEKLAKICGKTHKNIITRGGIPIQDEEIGLSIQLAWL